MTKSSDLLYKDLEGVTPQGKFLAIGTDDCMKAVVITRYEGARLSNTIRRFTGETAWADAVRHAGDLNAKDNRR